MTHPQRPDAIVIGGGPGGSTVATLLARRGCSVVLLERERFPRRHVGESLLPASMPVLEDLGVLDQVEAAGFPKKWGATMVWGADPEPWSWYFKETNRSYPHAYQVWRPAFDEILLDNARAAGVDVRERHTVIAPIIDRDRVAGVTFRAADGSERSIEADWVIDASGQAAVLSRAFGLREWDDYFRNMAVFSYFKGSRRLPEPDETNIFIESYENGWVWNIPLHGDLTSVGVVVDSDRGAQGIARHGVMGYYSRQLGSTAHTRDMLGHAKMVCAPQVVKDWSYASSRTIGDGWILVGDAACFIDPLFSSGVHLAMMSASMAAAYVDAAGRDPSIRGPAAGVCERLYRTEYTHFRELARLFYASNRTIESYFWEARRILGAPEDEKSRESFISAVAGQAPGGYERAVLDRGDLPTDVWRDIRDIESRRGSRRAEFDARSPLDAVPVLAEGVRLERRPVVVDGDFRWRAVLLSPPRPEGVPVSELVLALVSEIDGVRSTRQIVDRLTEGVASGDQREMGTQAVVDALRILVVDGAVGLQDGDRFRMRP